jgi:light-regulated signal transduction histidine kinase (bacteriophytochrome)
VEGLLEFTSVSRGHEFDLVDFDRVLRQAVRNLDSHIKETKASVSWGGDLPVLRLDVSQMVSVFQNLISNALKYHTSGTSPEVKILCSRENFGWKISVIDNGIGLNPSQLAKSFRVFQRFHSKDKYPGTGLGLAISQKIVHRHKGKIWLESAGEGMGAIANVWLPEC